MADLYGYSDKWSAQAGDTIDFFVTCEDESYTLNAVRLIHGDENPKGPGPKSEQIDLSINGKSYPGNVQHIIPGSYGVIDRFEKVSTQSFTLITWIWPTLPNGGEQGIITQWNDDTKTGFGLFLNGKGQVEFRLGVDTDGSKPVVMVAGQKLLARQWYQLIASFNADRKQAVFQLKPKSFHSGDYSPNWLKCDADWQLRKGPLLFAAGSIKENDNRRTPSKCFNGKIDSPLMYSAALIDLNADEWITEANCPPKDTVLAEWDLFEGADSRKIHDKTKNKLHGQLVNRPTRLVTGHNWRGVHLDPSKSPFEYNAIHFHDDDLEDAQWKKSFSLTIPEDLPSAVYAVTLKSESASDHIPFFVTTRKAERKNKIAFQVPTVSYLVYGNESLNPDLLPEFCPHRDKNLQKEDYEYLGRNYLRSVYDLHNDGSGICYGSIRRPVLTSMRTYHRSRFYDSPHQLSADLHLVDWLKEKNFNYDVITDHCVHREGVAAYEDYDAIISGTHPEYWTIDMLDALEQYIDQGGKYLYLGGNGHYWVTALDSEDQSIAEVRRINGTRSWVAEPGEGHLSFTGEFGGIWAARGRAPQRLVGVGFDAQGFDEGRCYVRTDASYDPEVAFIFEGLEPENRTIGDFPVLTIRHGAAGYEVDRADVSMGTPVNTYILATASGFSNCYQRAIEEIPITTSLHGGKNDPNVKADMIFYKTPKGGAVFSVGSISWCSGLSYNNYDNDVSAITENVIRHFVSG